MASQIPVAKAMPVRQQQQSQALAQPLPQPVFPPSYQLMHTQPSPQVQPPELHHLDWEHKWYRTRQHISKIWKINCKVRIDKLLQLDNNLHHRDHHLSINNEAGDGITALNPTSGIAKAGRAGDMVKVINRRDTHLLHISETALIQHHSHLLRGSAESRVFQ